MVSRSRPALVLAGLLSGCTFSLSDLNVCDDAGLCSDRDAGLDAGQCRDFLSEWTLEPDSGANCTPVLALAGLSYRTGQPLRIDLGDAGVCAFTDLSLSAGLASLTGLVDGGPEICTGFDEVSWTWTVTCDVLAFTLVSYQGAPFDGGTCLYR